MSDQYSGPWSPSQAPGDQPSAPNGWTQPEQPQAGQPSFTGPGYPQLGQDQPGYQQAPNRHQSGSPQPGYGQGGDPQSGYAQPGYPPVYPQPGYPMAGYPIALLRTDYAPWGQRVLAMLIDYFPTYVGLIIFYVGYGMMLVDMAQNGGSPDLSVGGIPMLIGSVIMLAALGWTIYNRWITAGRTGQSLGKRVIKISLISEATGQPIGALNAFLRDLVHILDGIAYVGYLWPLWDEKRQTFSDKIMKTIVVRVAQPPV
jgi:uncharacterized RDD family membrane protein YckC